MTCGFPDPGATRTLSTDPPADLCQADVDVHAEPMHLPPVADDQHGVVCRQQLLAAGWTANDIRRMVRRRELTPLHNGVYLEHTGAPTWIQAAWAAVLACQPAALAGPSALMAHDGPRRSGGDPLPDRPGGTPIHVVIPWERRLRVPGVVVGRRRDFDLVVRAGSPPRVRLEEAVIDLADRSPSRQAALEHFGRVVQRRQTTAARLLDTVRARPRLSNREWLETVLTDVAAGACSVLEQGYLTRVERAHGLPTAGRQVRDRLHRGVVYRDVDYDVGLVVELDGRLGHDSTSGRDADFDRDLESAGVGRRTVRISYGQVFERPCWTAAQVARLLQAHGWTGEPRRCPSCP